MEQQLKHIFSNDFPGISTFVSQVIEPVLGDNVQIKNIDYLSIHPERCAQAEAAKVSQCTYYADAMASGKRSPLVVYDVTLADNSHIERSRVAIKQFVSNLMDDYTHALIVFHYENPQGKSWRFSYTFREHKAALGATAKRFTYVFGSNYRCRTAVDRFTKLAQSERADSDFENAFKVSTLNDDFFNGYRELYADFVQYISGKRYEKVGKNKYVERVKHAPHSQFASSFNSDDKLLRDYIKKMMGRLVFLYFLQSKGWLAGNHNYMHDLFECSNKQYNFLDEVLEPLFFDILNTKPELRGDRARLLPDHEGIPYLNGGLFEQEEVDERSCVFPVDYFKRLFDFFDSYNFTIDENDPDDAEVGIDPEMLGRIFESLLEDNKDKGAFYTPKEIVEYMCKESLIAFLQGALPDIASDALRSLVERYETATFTSDQIKAIRKALIDVKICDPAIGSGAFPMGLINLLSRIHIALKPEVDRNKMKKWIIQQNIYGVDIEQGAVDIARLRFWLALVVDAEKPEPLPNLHFKIMQGNSLLETYCGKSLAHLGEPKPGTFDFNFQEEKEELENALAQLYNENDHEVRAKLMNSVKNIVVRRLIDAGVNEEDLVGLDVSANSKFFLWHTWFHDVFSRPEKQGFDIVIGNPPYVDYRSIDSVTKNGLQSYSTYQYCKTGNLYVYFIEMGLSVLCKDGSLIYINPYQYLSADSGQGLRNIIFKEKSLIKLIDVSNIKVFREANTYTSINFLKHINNNNVINIYKPADLSCLEDNSTQIEWSNVSCDKTYRIIISENPIVEKLDGIVTKLTHYADILCGLSLTGFRNYVATSKLDYGYLPFIESKEVKNYVTIPANKYITSSIFSARTLSAFNQENIFIARMTAHLRAALPNVGEAAGKVNVLFNLKINKYYLLGLLNSKLIDVYYRIKNESKHLNGKALSFDTPSLKELPIILAEVNQQTRIIECVQRIINLSQADYRTDISVLQTEIDELVMDIYNLSDSEKQFVRKFD